MCQENVIIITGKWSETNNSINKTFLKLVHIFNRLDYHLILLTPRSDMNLDNKQDSITIPSKESGNPIVAYLFNVIYQINLTLVLIYQFKSKKISYVLFCFAGDILLIPLIICKIFGKPIIIRSDGRPTTLGKLVGTSIFNLFMFGIVEKIAYHFSTLILLEAESMLSFYNFEEYAYKIRIAPLYVNTDLFSCFTPIVKRKFDVGYIGRLSSDKGILEFLEAISLLPQQYKILIIGDGPLNSKVKESCSVSNRDIVLLGWINNENLPEYYNQIKLFILPSYKEGLPNSILEAMACGTPILATPVGGIPWLIQDSITGYILQKNTPEIIAETIIRIFNDNNLELIAKNEVEMINEKCSFDKVLANYNDILRVNKWYNQ